MVNADRVYIVGVGMTHFGVFPDRSVKAMTAEAITTCLDDAGAEAADVGALFFANVGQGLIEGQTANPGQMAVRPLGFEGVPIVNTENACASGTTALHLAWAHVKAGLADCVMAVGAEKLSTDDSARRDALFEGGMDVHDREGVLLALRDLAGDDTVLEVEGDRSIFMDIYGFWARAHMHDFGSTQAQLAAISSKNHYHSTFNPNCHFQKEFRIDEVLAARPLAYPLTVPMCSPYSDGAAAVLVCSADKARALGATGQAVTIAALELASGVDRDAHDWDRHITKLTADRAYEVAGLGPGEMNVAELHDATAFGELLHAENLGLARRGEGGLAAERGETTLGGSIPINVSGGLESRGHPIAATGLAQTHELVMQLRGRADERQVDGARHAVLENGGGIFGVEEAAATVAIFSAPGA
ncbi:thiolase family protein [Prauserella halophila]|uniref:Thiolase family protein n=1 Tax=Prauserella halophila TaxID=185641 RepID=A0ABN1WFS0_9PSEU|nr:thiolase family protein [Prauserella halophila]MCP2238175.1 Acetyl-CoA acetyltransferase [Prauserella halophila]